MNEEFEIQQMNEEEARAAQQDEYIGDEPTEYPMDLKFEEQIEAIKKEFPSFNGIATPMILNKERNLSGVWVYCVDVWEGCLDKQKVRDAIEKIIKKNRPVGEFVDGYRAFSELKKRLGL